MIKTTAVISRSCGDGFKLLLPNPDAITCYGAALQVFPCNLGGCPVSFFYFFSLKLSLLLFADPLSVGSLVPLVSMHTSGKKEGEEGL